MNSTPPYQEPKITSAELVAIARAFSAPAEAPAALHLLARLRSAVLGVAILLELACVRGPRAALAAAMFGYLCRAGTRFAALIARAVAGTLKPPRRRRPNGTTRPAAPKPRLRFPHRRAWLLVETRHHGAAMAGTIRLALADPALAAIVAAEPRAQRILRPILHLLGISADCVPPLPRAAKPPAPQPPTPQQPVRPRHLTYAERKQALWYPNTENRPSTLQFLKRRPA